MKKIIKNTKVKQNTIIGKIGYCTNKSLGILNKKGDKDGGHYVYIRKVYPDGKCDVNIITSLEFEDCSVIPERIQKVKRGFLYPIPISDANFSLWSAINLDCNIKKMNLSKIDNIGYKAIKDKHKGVVDGFCSKKKPRA